MSNYVVTSYAQSYSEIQDALGFAQEHGYVRHDLPLQGTTRFVSPLGSEIIFSDVNATTLEIIWKDHTGNAEVCRLYTVYPF